MDWCLRVQGIFTYFFLKIFPCVRTEMKIWGFDGPLKDVMQNDGDFVDLILVYVRVTIA